MNADNQFPVRSGAVLSLSCNEGYELRGDETVTCTTNTEFQFSDEPSCGEWKLLSQNKFCCSFWVLKVMFYCICDFLTA